MEMGFPFSWYLLGNPMGMGTAHMPMGMGMATFQNSHRLTQNESNHLIFVNNIISSAFAF